MSTAAAILRKGWCPGALRPMQSGDGLIVRVRPRVGRFDLDAARMLADAAQRLGNGHIDLTRRANLQIRGLSESHLDEQQAELVRFGLLDDDAASEAVRNVMVAPLAERGSVACCIAERLEEILAGDPRLRGLPAKFGVLVDGEGPVSISGERADISLRVASDAVAFGIDTMEGTRWLGACASRDAVELVVAAMQTVLECVPRSRVRDLSAAALSKLQLAVMPRLQPLPPLDPPPGRVIGLVDDAVGVAAPFGRLEAGQLRRLADLATMAGARDLRLSPWRTLYMRVRDVAAGQVLLDEARSIGLIVDERDPLLRIEACPGAPACASGTVDARGDARRLARVMAERRFGGTVHVSGCAKGCARSAPSDLVLVGEAGRYGVVRGGTTRDATDRTIRPADLESLLPEPSHG
jgi:precorrin-3B synthase